MERQYDLVVVGTGVTSAVASRCREAGWTVAVLDSRPFGGTCALRGCVPKKILVSAAEAVHGARDMAGKGVPAGSLPLLRLTPNARPEGNSSHATRVTVEFQESSPAQKESPAVASGAHHRD